VAASDATATLAGGCFWAMQSEFQKLKGVHQVQAGYSGGSVPNPTYDDVCTGRTGHAESIEIKFDPKQISYAELVRIFLTDIDPTTLDRQGPDRGTQYRSAIFFHDPQQEADAKKVIADLTASKVYSAPIVTEVVPYKAFYAAEDYHQNYFENNPNQPYCASVVGPEVHRFMELNKAKLKEL
ncbi:unnamed protein product, partial [Phaeothamnion confervicola]